MKILALSVITALLALAAGCTTEPTTDAEPSEPAAPEPPVAPASLRPEVTILPIEMVMAVGVHEPVPAKVQHPGHERSFDVGDAASVLVEAMWTCPSPTCTMRVEVWSPDYEVERHESGDASIRLPIDDLGGPWEDTWQVAVFADGAAAVIEGEIRISVFEHGPVPADYSAF